MDEDWPDASLKYDRPDDDERNRLRWQQALNAALASGALELQPTEDSNTYDLTGRCPRCGHETHQEVWFDFVQGWRTVEGRINLWPWKKREKATFNFDCLCDNTHENRPSDVKGCGWGGPLSVTVSRPAS